MTSCLVITVVLTALGLTLLATRRGRLSGTTLIAPWRWCVFAMTLICAAEAWPQFTHVEDSTLAVCRYAAAAATFCPLIAVLGAKRPQHVAWQLIVASFWGVLILPVAEVLILWRGGTLDIGPMRQWLFVILLLLGLGNYSLSRFRIASLFAVCGQTLLLLPYLPVIGRPWRWNVVAGVSGLVVALATAWWQTRRPAVGGGWNTVWRDFRNAFGLVWSLRVMERVNSAVNAGDRTQELGWYGFKTEPLSDDDETLRRTLKKMLRRFVSAEWLARRDVRE